MLSTSRPPYYSPFIRVWMIIFLLLADIIGVYLATRIILLLDGHYLFPKIPIPLEFFTLRFLVVIPLLYATFGLYNVTGLPLPKEFMLITFVNALNMLIVTWEFWIDYHAMQALIVLFWFLVLILTQCSRVLMRFAATKLDMWGEPVVVVGDESILHPIMNFFRARKRLGIRPVVWVDLGLTDLGHTLPLPLLSLKEYINKPGILQKSGIKTALIVMSFKQISYEREIVKMIQMDFERSLLIDGMSFFDGSTVMSSYDLEGLGVIELRQNLLRPQYRLLKRVVEFLFILAAIPFVVPAMGLLSLLVRLDSPGPIFYRHDRIGQDGLKFSLIKFRTMVQNADATLQTYLDINPLEQTEWNKNQKLRSDPRITRVGKFLRHSSLDELPQLWNVLVGQMSLVGPRPYTENQINTNENLLRLYQRVLPGMTGLWQVSGRADTTFIERLRLDSFYIQNWSPWLDIYIMLRTVLVVLRRDGAY